MNEEPKANDKALAPASTTLPSLEDGIARYREGDGRAAHAIFERCHRRAPADTRTMSWYGLTLVLVEKNSNLGILYCDQAIRLAGPDTELLLNQARAHLAIAQRERAVRSIQRGLALAPGDPALTAAQEAIGWRRKPVFPCLRRSNPLNRLLGKLRHRWSRALHPRPPPTPMSLGLLPPAADDEQGGSTP